MPYGICRVKKIKAAAVSAMQYHNDRLPGEHSNPDIDLARSGENREYIDHGDYKVEVGNRIEEGRKSSRKVRKDAVVLVEGLITASPEFFEGKDAGEVDRWARDCLGFVESEFGAANLVHFTLHLDETTPHIHFGAVPLKDGSLSWKKFFPSKIAMSKFQDRFYEQVSRKWGLERGEKRQPGQKTRRHKDVSEFKAAQVRELDAEIARKTDRLESLQQEVASAERGLSQREAVVAEVRAARKSAQGRVGTLKRSLAKAARAVRAAAMAVLTGLPVATEMAQGVFYSFQRYFIAHKATEGPLVADVDGYEVDPAWLSPYGATDLGGAADAAAVMNQTRGRSGHGHVADQQTR